MVIKNHFDLYIFYFMLSMSPQKFQEYTWNNIWGGRINFNKLRTVKNVTHFLTSRPGIESCPSDEKSTMSLRGFSFTPREVLKKCL